jgi:hypothetical protein
MSYFSKKDYNFVKFEKSKNTKKKYTAIIQNKKTKKLKKINFGASAYSQYKDTTGLKLYSHLDHLDKKRQTSYKKRHMVYIKKGFYSAGYFSMVFLWSFNV